MHILERILLLVGLIFVLIVAAHGYAAWRLHSALVESGMSSRVASCMTRRMMKRLTLIQVARLRKLEGDKPTLGAWVKAVKGVDDRRVILVTTTSAALCKSGLAQ